MWYREGMREREIMCAGMRYVWVCAFMSISLHSLLFKKGRDRKTRRERESVCVRCVGYSNYRNGISRRLNEL